MARTCTRPATTLRLVKFLTFHKNGSSNSSHNSQPLLYPKPDQSTLRPSITIHFNILLPFASRSSKLSPYFRIPHQNPVAIYILHASPTPIFLILLSERCCSPSLRNTVCNAHYEDGSKMFLRNASTHLPARSQSKHQVFTEVKT